MTLHYNHVFMKQNTVFCNLCPIIRLPQQVEARFISVFLYCIRETVWLIPVSRNAEA